MPASSRRTPPQLARWIADGKRPYFFMHAPDDTYAPENAYAFHRLLRDHLPVELPHAQPAALPEPQRVLEHQDQAGEKGGDGDFVGGVVDGGGDTGGGHGLAGEAEHRETRFVDGAEIEGKEFREIERGVDAGGALRVE